MEPMQILANSLAHFKSFVEFYMYAMNLKI